MDDKKFNLQYVVNINANISERSMLKLFASDDFGSMLNYQKDLNDLSRVHEHGESKKSFFDRLAKELGDKYSTPEFAHVYTLNLYERMRDRRLSCACINLDIMSDYYDRMISLRNTALKYESVYTVDISDAQRDILLGKYCEEFEREFDDFSDFCDKNIESEKYTNVHQVKNFIGEVGMYKMVGPADMFMKKYFADISAASENISTDHNEMMKQDDVVIERVKERPWTPDHLLNKIESFDICIPDTDDQNDDFDCLIV